LFYTQGNSDQYRFYRCENCGLVNLDLSGLDHRENQEKYAREYPNPHDPRVNRGPFGSYAFIEKMLPAKGRFLDVGCGNGALLARARDSGWDVRGLELSPFLADQVEQHLRIEVEVADFMSYEPTGRQFDLVSLRHVLEHLPDSNRALRSIARLLKSGGHALLEFPNIDGLSFRLRRARQRLGWRKRYAADYRPGHCNEFSRSSFEFLLGRTGFELVVWQTYTYRPFKNFLYNHIHIGTKARALIRKVDESAAVPPGR